jgi:hypothetical protein
LVYGYEYFYSIVAFNIPKEELQGGGDPDFDPRVGYTKNPKPKDPDNPYWLPFIAGKAEKKAAPPPTAITFGLKSVSVAYLGSGQAKVSIDAVTPGGVNWVSADLQSDNWDYVYASNFVLNQTTGMWEGTVNLWDGNWKVTYINVDDQNYNYNINCWESWQNPGTYVCDLNDYVNFDYQYGVETGIAVAAVTVSGVVADTTPPVLTGLTATVSGSSVTVTVNVTEPSGIDYAWVYLDKTNYTGYQSAPLTETSPGTLTATLTLSSGSWRVSGVDLEDKFFNWSSYYWDSFTNTYGGGMPYQDTGIPVAVVNIP